MPFIANTPESLIARSDSRNAATTCRGITSAGRPCRRPLATSQTPDQSPYSRGGSNTNGDGLHTDETGEGRFYCWQHKEQAVTSNQSGPGHHASPTTALEGRSSLDTLADRLGLMSVSSVHRRNSQSKHEKPHLPSPNSKGRSIFCCCFQPPIDEIPEPPPRPSQRPPSHSGPMKQQHFQPTSTSNTAGHHPPKNSDHPPASSAAHQIAQHASLVPQSASPQTASLLMAELAKPISQTDEAGYIYMFWLTPESGTPAPTASAARSLLVPSGQPTTGGQRRGSDVLESYAAAQPKTRGVGGGGGTGTLLLKIGRANNVQRRLNEWKRQCGYDLSLIRYYPYISSASATSGDGDPSTALPRKLPHSHKVERLIHIELAGRGLRIMDGEKCPACNREHREWFQVEATRKAVMEVDEAIRRWSDWDEGRLRGAK